MSAIVLASPIHGQGASVGVPSKGGERILPAEDSRVVTPGAAPRGAAGDYEHRSNRLVGGEAVLVRPHSPNSSGGTPRGFRVGCPPQLDTWSVAERRERGDRLRQEDTR